MEPKDLSTICQELIRWQHTRKNAKILQRLFRDHIGFRHIAPQTGFPPPESRYLHLYPGIAEISEGSKEDLQLNFYLLPDVFDNERSLENGEMQRNIIQISLAKDGIRYDTVEAGISHNLTKHSNGPISVEDGIERILLWANIRDTWLRAATENGIYSALTIPAEDIREIDTDESGKKTVAAYFALKMTTVSSSFVLFWADLVLNRSPAAIGILHDTVRPVPPFGLSFEEEHFFLLKYAPLHAVR
jgi:hypothetical protein